MSQARSSTSRTFAAHAILILWTLIALFPVFVIVVNSFKNRRAIFNSPLALPGRETFDTIGYTTVLQQGDFLLYFQHVGEFAGALAKQIGETLLGVASVLETGLKVEIL